MEQVFLFASSLGDGPVYICGDFNSGPLQNQAVSQALRTGEWVDIIEHECAAARLVAPFTFIRGSGKKQRASRIDYVLSNSDGCSVFLKSWRQKQSGLPDHVPVGVSLSIPKCVDRAYVIPHEIKRSFPPKPRCAEQWSLREAVCEPILQEFVPQLVASAEALNVELTWGLACQAVSCMLDAIATSAGSEKGGFPEFQLGPVTKKPKEVSLRTKRIAQISALFREMIRKASLYETNQSFAWRNSFNSTLHKLERTLQLVEFPFPEGFLRNRSNFSKDFEFFQEWDRKFDSKIRASGLKAWRKKLRVSNAADKKLVHRYVDEVCAEKELLFLHPESPEISRPERLRISELSSALHQFSLRTHRQFKVEKVIYYKRQKATVSHSRLLEEKESQTLLKLAKKTLRAHNRSDEIVSFTGKSADGTLLTFKEQYRLFNSAYLAFGPHGAGMANVLWMQSSCDQPGQPPKVIEFMCSRDTADVRGCFLASGRKRNPRPMSYWRLYGGASWIKYFVVWLLRRHDYTSDFARVDLDGFELALNQALTFADGPLQ
eukprot:s3307_g8.t1